MTPGEARRILALPCLYILFGLASPKFSNTSVGEPSTFVTIVQVRRGEFYGRKVVFPVYCNGIQWQEAVVPVLTDPRWDLRSSLNRRLLCAGGGQMRLIDQIGKALEESFIAAGYGPGPEL